MSQAHDINSEKSGDSLRSIGWESCGIQRSLVSPCGCQRSLFLRQHWAGRELGLPLLGKLSAHQVQRGHLPGATTVALAHWFVSPHSYNCFHPGDTGIPRTGQASPQGPASGQTLKSSFTLWVRAQVQIAEGQDKGKPSRQLGIYQRARIPSRPGRTAVKAWLCGQSVRANCRSPFLGAQHCDLAKPQPERAGQTCLPRKAVAIFKQVLWLSRRKGNFREDDGEGGKEGDQVTAWGGKWADEPGKSSCCQVTLVEDK